MSSTVATGSHQEPPTSASPALGGVELPEGDDDVSVDEASLLPSLDVHPWAADPSLVIAPKSDDSTAAAGNEPSDLVVKGEVVRTFRWFAPNLRKLTRKNKISSKSFTVFPDQQVEGDAAAGVQKAPHQGWQFRMVLLRGLEKAPEEANDPVGLFIEYQPVEGGEDSQRCVRPQHPGQTKATCTILFPEEAGLEGGCATRTTSLKEEQTLHFRQGEHTMAFRTILPASKLSDDEWVPDGNCMIELTLHTGLPSLQEKMEKTSEKVTTSFWKGVSALSSGFSALKQTVSDTVAQQLHAEVSSDRKEEPQPAPPLPWDTLPPRWRNRQPEWQEWLTETLPQNDLTFIQGPERCVSSDEQVLMAQNGLSHKAVVSANSMFDFETDVHEGLLSLDVLRTQRYHLVPALVSDENFWKNYLWKVAALSSCQNDEQAHILMSILNAPGPNAPPTLLRSPHSAGQGDASSPSSQQPAPALSDEDVAVLVKESAEAVALLNDLIDDGEDLTAAAVDHGMVASALKACHAQKKAVSNATERLQASQPSSPAGSLQSAGLTHKEPLAAILTDLNTVILRYEAEVKKAVEGKREAPVEPQSVEHKVESTPPSDAVEAEAVGSLVKSNDEEVQPEAATIEQADDHDALPEDSPPPKPPVTGATIATAAPTVATGSKLSTDPDDFFGDLPSIDETDTPTRPATSSVPPGQMSAAAARTGSTTGKRSMASAASSDFAKMPWEDDDEFA